MFPYPIKQDPRLPRKGCIKKVSWKKAFRLLTECHVAVLALLLQGQNFFFAKNGLSSRGIKLTAGLCQTYTHLNSAFTCVFDIFIVYLQ